MTTILDPENIFQAVGVLKAQGISPSQQRVKILENLQSRRDHPRVEEIFSQLIGVIPTLSRTTVYNTLKLFVSKGLVQEILIDGYETRYDFDTTVHGHFRCDICGAVIDIFSDMLKETAIAIEKNLPDGYAVRARHMYFQGCCSKCSAGIDNSLK